MSKYVHKYCSYIYLFFLITANAINKLRASTAFNNVMLALFLNHFVNFVNYFPFFIEIIFLNLNKK